MSLGTWMPLISCDYLKHEVTRPLIMFWWCNPSNVVSQSEEPTWENLGWIKGAHFASSCKSLRLILYADEISLTWILSQKTSCTLSVDEWWSIPLDWKSIFINGERTRDWFENGLSITQDISAHFLRAVPNFRSWVTVGPLMTRLCRDIVFSITNKRENSRPKMRVLLDAPFKENGFV